MSETKATTNGSLHIDIFDHVSQFEEPSSSHYFILCVSFNSAGFFFSHNFCISISEGLNIRVVAPLYSIKGILNPLSAYSLFIGMLDHWTEY